MSILCYKTLTQKWVLRIGIVVLEVGASFGALSTARIMNGGSLASTGLS